MEITKVVKPVIRRGANTFGNIVYYCSYTDAYLIKTSPDLTRHNYTKRALTGKNTVNYNSDVVSRRDLNNPAS